MKIIFLIIVSILLTACPQKKNATPVKGYVKMRYTVTEDGSVKNPVVLYAQPKGIFDIEALRAILKLKFVPKIENGKPVKYTTIGTIEFRLSENQ